MMNDDLAHQQRQFAAQVASVKPLDSLLPSSEAKFVQTPLNVDRGLDVYRNNLNSAWRNALASTYPVLEQLIGKDGFTLTVRDYLIVHPSQSGDLNALGESLARFLYTYEPLLMYPYLPAVAELEWRVHLSHDAANHVALSVEDLMAQEADEWLSATVKSAPSSFLLKLPYAAGRIWQAHQADGDLSTLKDNPISESECLLVSRPLWRVQVQILSEAEYRLLERLRDGDTFEQAFECLENEQLEVDFVAFLPRCLEAGVWATLSQA